VNLIALIPLRLAFERRKRKHHKNLESTVSATSPVTGQAGKPKLPRGQSVTSTGSDLIEVTTTLIPSSELPARGNRYRETSRQRELLPSRQ
jgi:hypothetical protein